MKYLDAEKGKALSQNRIHSIVRSVWFCSGAGGNIHCRKPSPCSTRAKGNMYPWPDRLRLCEAAHHPAPLRVTFDRRRRERGVFRNKPDRFVRGRFGMKFALPWAYCCEGAAHVFALICQF